MVLPRAPCLAWGPGVQVGPPVALLGPSTAPGAFYTSALAPQPVSPAQRRCWAGPQGALQPLRVWSPEGGPKELPSLWIGVRGRQAEPSGGHGLGTRPPAGVPVQVLSRLQVAFPGFTLTPAYLALGASCWPCRQHQACSRMAAVAFVMWGFYSCFIYCDNSVSTLNKLCLQLRLLLLWVKNGNGVRWGSSVWLWPHGTAGRGSPWRFPGGGKPPPARRVSQGLVGIPVGTQVGQDQRARAGCAEWLQWPLEHGTAPGCLPLALGDQSRAPLCGGRGLWASAVRCAVWTRPLLPKKWPAPQGLQSVPTLGSHGTRGPENTEERLGRASWSRVGLLLRSASAGPCGPCVEGSLATS